MKDVTPSGWRPPPALLTQGKTDTQVSKASRKDVSSFHRQAARAPVEEQSQ